MTKARRRKPSDAETWREHEHVSTPVENQAQRLVDEAGSPELAKQAVDSLGAFSGSKATAQSLATSAHDQFARELGFASYLSLFEASTPIKSAAGRQWFTTALRNDQWIVWNDADLEVAGTYLTREAAERSMPSAEARRPR
jgi:hypothetical protein